MVVQRTSEVLRMGLKEEKKKRISTVKRTFWNFSEMAKRRFLKKHSDKRKKPPTTPTSLHSMAKADKHAALREYYQVKNFIHPKSQRQMLRCLTTCLKVL